MSLTYAMMVTIATKTYTSYHIGKLDLDITAIGVTQLATAQMSECASLQYMHIFEPCP
jgi:hypothetical protein